jgi:hypothetical protein
VIVVASVMAAASFPALAYEGGRDFVSSALATTSADDPVAQAPEGSGDTTEALEGGSETVDADPAAAGAVADPAAADPSGEAASTDPFDAAAGTDAAAGEGSGGRHDAVTAGDRSDASAVEPGPETTTLGVRAQVVPGNPDCADLLGDDGFLFERKLEPVQDATIALSDDGMSGILVVDVTGKTFDFTFSGDFEATAVIVKGGPNANFYDYAPDGATADTDLHAPVNPTNDEFYGLSHISFCVVAAGEEEQPNPDIRLVKTADPTLVHVGDTIAYTFEVTNTGEEDLFDVTLTDDTGICDADPVLVDDADGDTTLAVDETWTYTCDHVATADDPSRLENTATVVAVNEAGGEVSDEDDAVVRIIHPDIDLDKSVSETTVPEGTTVTYTFVVTNTGDTTLSDVTVVDDVMGTVGTISELAAGASTEFTATFTVQDQPVTNVAVASGTDVLGTTVTAEDSVTVTPIAGAGPGPGSGAGPGGGTIVGGGGGTPFTGSDAGWLTIAALTLLGSGVVLVAATRRRGRDEAV